MKTNLARPLSVFGLLLAMLAPLVLSSPAVAFRGEGLVDRLEARMEREARQREARTCREVRETRNARCIEAGVRTAGAIASRGRGAVGAIVSVGRCIESQRDLNRCEPREPSRPEPREPSRPEPRVPARWDSPDLRDLAL